MKRLIAAVAAMRAKLALVEAHLEEGNEARALEVLDEATRDWQQAIEELRAA